MTTLEAIEILVRICWLIGAVVSDAVNKLLNPGGQA